MACKIEILKTIEKSINDKTDNGYTGYTKQEATNRKVFLNSLWGPIATVEQTTGDGGYTVLTTDKSKNEAVDREYIVQTEAENLFERDLDFFNDDVALFEQEQQDLNNTNNVFPQNNIVSNLNNTDINTPIKEGVSDLFEQSPELANIGTQQQYSNYLDSIFPDSKVKDIVYHGTDNEFDEFDKNKIGENTLADKSPQLGIFFSNSVEIINNAFSPKIIKPVLLNIKNPNILESLPYMIGRQEDNISKEKFDGIIGEKTEDPMYGGRDMYSEYSADTYIVFEPEQIHILGNENDIQGFKEFINNTNDNVSELEPQELAYIEEQNTDNEDIVSQNDVSLNNTNESEEERMLNEMINNGEIQTYCN